MVVVLCHVITYYMLAYISAAYSQGGKAEKELEALQEDFMRILDPNSHLGLSITDQASIMTSKVQRAWKTMVDNRLNSDDQPRGSGGEGQSGPTMAPTAHLQQIRDEGRRKARALAQEKHDKKRTDFSFV